MATGQSSSETTQDHDRIRHWIEQRGGRPAIVKGTQSKGASAGLLRVKFDESEDNLEDVEWDEFFDTFDDNGLTFLYQETIEGNQSRFFKFIRQ